MRPAEYWGSTLPEIAAFLEGRGRALRDVSDIAKLGAWYSVYLDRVEDFPGLADLLNPERKRRQDANKEETISRWKAFFSRQRAAVVNG